MARHARSIFPTMDRYRLSIVLVALAAATGSAATNELVSAALAARGGPGGLCCLPAGGNAAQVEALVRDGGYFVLALHDDAAVVTSLRVELGARRLLGTRAIVERGGPAAVPLADGTANVIALPDLTPATLGALRSAELLRALAPRGVLLLSGGAPTVDGAADWLAAGGVTGVAVEASPVDGWLVLRKAPPAGGDAWGNWNHGSDNNPVSSDSAARWPLTMQWFGEPHYAMRVGFHLVAGGRYFFATTPVPAYAAITDAPGTLNQAHTLIARDGSNGEFLWQRPLPPASLMMHSVWMATEDRFFLTEGPDVVALDAGNGREADRYRIGNDGQQVKWMVLEENRLFALLGEPDASGYDRRPKGSLTPAGFGALLRAYDVTARRTRWEHAAAAPIDGHGVGLSAGRLFYYAPSNSLTALSVDSGAVLWQQRGAETISLFGEPHTPGALDGITGHRAGLLCTPEVVVMNMNSHKHRIAFSAKDGTRLWQSELLGGNQGRGGHMMALDGLLLAKGMRPEVCDLATGAAAKDRTYNFGGGCGRFTASPYLLIGMLGGIYDRQTGFYMSQNVAKPDCHVGTFVADGLVYNPPGSCKCALPFRGMVVRGSAAAEPAPTVADAAARLVCFDAVAPPLPVLDDDWPAYRGGASRSSSSPCRVGMVAPAALWCAGPTNGVQPTAPVAVGDRVFWAGADGRVACLAAGKPSWEFYTGGAILTAPTVADGRVYVGSMDGSVYCLSAVSGRPLWQYRAAPVDRRIMVYGHLSSKWPITGGVLVHAGTAYAAAALTDLDGWRVHALDAVTGRVKWTSTNLGWMHSDRREGFVPLGRLTVAGNRLWIRTDKAVPCALDLATGELAPCPDHLKNRDGTPRLDGSGAGGPRGQDIGVFAGRFLIEGGHRFWSSSYEREPDHGTGVCFLELDAAGLGQYPGVQAIESSALLPAWDAGLFVRAAEQYRAPRAVEAWDAAKTAAWLTETRVRHTNADRPKPLAHQVAADAVKDTVPKIWGPQLHAAQAVALSADAVVVAELAAYDKRARAFKEARLSALSRADGAELWSVRLPADPLYDGICIDRQGRIVVALVDGRIACFGAPAR